MLVNEITVRRLPVDDRPLTLASASMSKLLSEVTRRMFEQQTATSLDLLYDVSHNGFPFSTDVWTRGIVGTAVTAHDRTGLFRAVASP